LIVSSDCGFGRQGCNREIAFYKATAIAQGCNIVRRELGLPVSDVRAADPALQTDIVPKSAASTTSSSARSASEPPHQFERHDTTQQHDVSQQHP